ncbi:MAG TPA: SDR family oxidoreductase [Burkholderiaceae bacterium]|nr:SDR family oxidoreductase [Burkholderiaceae bacterium]
MPTALIIGASRGIGRELVRQYRAQGWRILASARRDDDLAELGVLGAEPHRIDVDDVNDWAALGWLLDCEPVDVAFYVSGVYGPSTAGLEAPSQAEFDHVMHTNVLGAMRMASVVAPAVAAAHGRLVVLSSHMGSIGDRSNGSAWLYRASKAALNSVLKDISLFHPAGTMVAVSLHPGWVRTDMGGANASLSVEDSVASIRNVVSQLQPTHHGGFFNYDGKPLSW